MPWEPLVYAGVLVVGVVAAFLVGRRTSSGQQRARELEIVVEDLRKDHECTLSELEAARHELKRTQRELSRYRDDVVDHFAGTSELLRDLTLQYRAVYDHLSQGATLLCPEDTPALESGFASGAIPPDAAEPAREPAGGAPGPDSAPKP